MPIYEYRCACGHELSALILNRREEKDVRCPRCGGRRLRRLLSRFAYHQSEEARLAEFDTSRPRDESFYRDSRNVGLWAKKRARELGVDLGPRFEETVERARTGKILEDL